MSTIQEVHDVLPHGNHHRNYEPAHFRAILDGGGPVEASLVRRALRRLDGGRFRPMLDEAHTVMAYSDLEGQRHFAETFPGLLEWVSVFGAAEDLARFEEYLESDTDEDDADDIDIKPNYGTYRGL